MLLEKEFVKSVIRQDNTVVSKRTQLGLFDRFGRDKDSIGLAA